MTISFRFRPLELFLLLLPILGFCLKYMHLPLANILLLISMPLPLVYYLMRGIAQINKNPNLPKENKAFLPSSFLGGSITIWLLYLTWKLFFLPVVTPFFYLGCLISVGALYITLRHKAVEWIPLLAFVFFAGCAVILYSVPTYKVYHFMYFQENDITDKEIPAHTWDTYSWHLYQGQKFDQALNANTKAKEAAIWESKISGDGDSLLVFEQLDSNRHWIETRTWDYFISLGEIQQAAQIKSLP